MLQEFGSLHGMVMCLNITENVVSWSLRFHDSFLISRDEINGTQRFESNYLGLHPVEPDYFLKYKASKLLDMISTISHYEPRRLRDPVDNASIRRKCNSEDE